MVWRILNFHLNCQHNFYWNFTIQILLSSCLEEQWLSVLLCTAIFSGFELNEKSELTVCCKNEEIAAAVINPSFCEKEREACCWFADGRQESQTSMRNGAMLRSNELNSSNCTGDTNLFPAKKILLRSKSYQPNYFRLAISYVSPYSEEEEQDERWWSVWL